MEWYANDDWTRERCGRLMRGGEDYGQGDGRGDPRALTGVGGGGSGTPDLPRKREKVV